MGANIEHDAHARLPLSPPKARHNGTKMWVFSPDFNQVAKYADEWVAVNAGQDGAWWMAVNHVLLTEFHHQKTDAVLHRLHQEVHRRALPGRAQARRRRRRAAGPDAARRSTRAVRRRGARRVEVPDVGRSDQRAQNADGQQRLPLGQRKRASGICCSRTARTAATSIRSSASLTNTTASSRSSWTTSAAGERLHARRAGQDADDRPTARKCRSRRPTTC